MKQQIKVTIYRGVNPKAEGLSSLDGLLKKVSTNKDMLKQGALLRDTHQNKPYEEYKVLKEKAWGFSIGNFSRRDSDSCLEYFPVLGFDFDSISTASRTKEVLKSLKEWDYSFLVMPSLSGTGIRLMVYTNSTIESHEMYYSSLCRDLNAITGVPLKSDIKSALQKQGKNSVEINRYLKINEHLDDSTKDFARFWFISGIPASEIYKNNESKIYDLDEQIDPVNNSSSAYYTLSNRELVEAYVDAIVNSGTDITRGVREWYKIGNGLINEFGGGARDYFHAVSQYHPDYDYNKADREFNRQLSKHIPGRVTIASFFKWCHDSNVRINRRDLAKGMSTPRFAKIQQKQKELTTEDKLNIERCLLGACLKWPELIDVVYDTCPKFGYRCFSINSHKDVFWAIEMQLNADLSVNRATVWNRLQKGGKNVSEDFVDGLCSQYLFEKDIETHTMMIFDSYTRIAMNIALSECKEILFDYDRTFENIVSDLERKISELSDLSNESVVSTFSDLTSDMVKSMEEIQKRNEESDGDCILGVPTGFKDLDENIFGWIDTEFNVIAARPGMGKSAFAVKCGVNAAKAGYPVSIWSGEMSGKEIVTRAYAQESGIDLKKLKKSNLSEVEWNVLHSAIERLNGLPLSINTKGGISLRAFSRWARKEVKKGTKLFILDYVQLMSGPESDVRVKLVNITRGLKALSKDLNVPIIGLSQLSRAVEVRGGSKRPQLSDLKESGSIEEDADKVLFLYRPEYYDIVEDADGNSLRGICEVITAKHRDGSLETTYVKFQGSTVSFSDLEGEYKPIKVEVEKDYDSDWWKDSGSKMNEDEDCDIDFRVGSQIEELSKSDKADLEFIMNQNKEKYLPEENESKSVMEAARPEEGELIDFD